MQSEHANFLLREVVFQMQEISSFSIIKEVRAKLSEQVHKICEIWRGRKARIVNSAIKHKCHESTMMEKNQLFKWYVDVFEPHLTEVFC